LRTTTSQEEVTQPWFDDDWGQTIIQQKIRRDYITNEDDALLKYPNNFQGGYAIVNQEQRNKWGSPRGYAIHPGNSPIHNVRFPFHVYCETTYLIPIVLRRRLLVLKDS
jgi:primary-amine oxidase